MSKNAIEVTNLSKMYKLYPSQGKRFLDYLSFGKYHPYHDFWALQNISFSIQKGCSFGILGQNGSGKSTLLSILAGVLEPTKGTYQVNGKVSAILELGAGFHPEFSGRANIYMYGSIMGLSKEYIDKKMPEIIHFSELGDFMDQPLRTYSSGMYARLAFSVAVNVNADILIVDEVLAVGDLLFQHRCFRKIQELKDEGVTILYVGHDTGVVRSVCDQAMILDGGEILNIGESAKITNEYYALIAEREKKFELIENQEYGKRPDNKWSTIYNFIDHLSEADIKSNSPDQIREMNIEVNSSPRRTIFAHPPSSINYLNLIPDNCILSFAIGIYNDVYDYISVGIRFRILIEETEVFSKILDPKKNPSDKGWHNQIVDLSTYARKKVRIRFITEGSGIDLSYCWGGWGWIKMLSKSENNAPHIKIGDTKYENHINLDSKTEILIDDDAIEIGNKKVVIENVFIKNINGEICSQFISGEKIIVEVIITANASIEQEFYIGSVLFNKQTRIAGTNTHHNKCNIPKINRGEKFKVTFTYNGILRHGLYSITIGTGIFSKDQRMEIIERFHKIDEKFFFNVLKDNMCDGIVDLCEEVRVENI